MQEFKSQQIKAVIKDLLKRKNITYENLAEQMDCSIPTVKRILGPEEMTLNRLLALCEIVEISLGELEILIQQGKETAEEFTDEQQKFLVKNPRHFSYLMKLFGGENPRQIAEKYALSPRSTDKYLIALEKQGLIHVTGKQKVKPAFKGPPSFGKGVLADAYYKAFIQNAATFFIDQLGETLRSQAPEEGNKKTGKGKLSLQAIKVSRGSYDAWRIESEQALQKLGKIGSFEEKTKDPSELMTAVILEADSFVKNDYPGLATLENTFGDITNL